MKSHNTTIPKTALAALIDVTTFVLAHIYFYLVSFCIIVVVGIDSTTITVDHDDTQSSTCEIR